MIYFTADEHYGHTNIIKYCKRKFNSIEEMDLCLIENNNSIVKKGDTVYHIGDFTLRNNDFAKDIILKLNGAHIFVGGSHDGWLGKGFPLIREIKIEKQNITLCHYAMRRWAKSHYGAWQLYGHSHGELPPEGKQWDVGVDNNNFFPVSFEELKKIMENQPMNEENHAK